MKKIGVMLILCAAIWACKKGTDLIEDNEVFVGFVQPSNFPEPAYDFTRNPITKEGFELGRKLFYEPRLSRNNSIACGSCHIQSAAFTHHGHDVSHGIDDRLGTRNPMPIMNMAWHKEFFWDGGAYHLDLAPINAIHSEVEMDETLPNVLIKLRARPEYRALFKKAFGTDEITDEYFLKALSQFMLLATSANSKYDKVMRAEDGATFTTAEKNGYLLFQKQCASCHSEPLFTDLSYRNNGIRPNRSDDHGRATVTANDKDMYKFKVPSLRNLSYTAPYTHDGRYLSVSRMLDHYRFDVSDLPTLDPIFKRADGTFGIPMTDAEKSDLLAFLKTLEDPTFLSNSLLSEPFGSEFIVN
ncbi:MULTISPECIES: cytochrome-c peroxidase [Sphingobacterium]|uniref:Cytochrome-c peroxidase n=1 Tax=Sphingobacterium populi TaxID=1812824 RepID=A0ABW5UAD5_9SPHI|nr:cytochrome c peroxidase [Sphingobacterium sp. CFCC 11742]